MKISDFEKEIEWLRNNLDSGNRRYYHLNSITNFLFHLSELDADSKEDVLNLLTQCYNYYKAHSIRNISESLNVFQEYLQPVGKIYEQKIGFFILIKPWLLSLYIIVGYTVFFLIFSNNLIMMTIFFLIVLIFFIYLVIKFSQRKLYAFLW